MTDLEIVAVLACALALVSLVAYGVSLSRRVVTGPRWAAWTVLVGLGGSWAVAWFIAQASVPAPGWASTTAVSALAVTATVGGGPVATAALRLADPRHDLPNSPPEAGDPPPGPAEPELLRGGALVGLLERASTVALLLLGFPEGLALVLGIKGLGRFGELRGQAAPERFIVGTLASLLWAILGYAAIRAVLS